MKKYPKVDWKPIDKYSRRKMDKYEKIILDYLKHEEYSKKWESYQWAYTKEVLAYNLSFLLLDE